MDLGPAGIDTVRFERGRPDGRTRVRLDRTPRR